MYQKIADAGFCFCFAFPIAVLTECSSKAHRRMKIVDVLRHHYKVKCKRISNSDCPRLRFQLL
ncbi:hypothetical protein M431DRAFT_508411 [Trichoderma harzianum CBS 226.95]|uniref:Uncharacterized protein n=1 Tax=Trichoderma harzianum CBS 226.95 TaxID=983964 RepID=A0A2T4AD29_TRIHA|nr:hypothetical protein M431DRAFT_508411 [Trichoderma harzianum CBS 226.95]PTB54994.1 hypothetical protein M431DRAFT_508411 [Trichoderma harzianum CBS 226.95]